MRARVSQNRFGAWVGSCAECRATISGSMYLVDLWADVHNADVHPEPQQ